MGIIPISIRAEIGIIGPKRIISLRNASSGFFVLKLKPSLRYFLPIFLIMQPNFSFNAAIVSGFFARSGS